MPMQPWFTDALMCFDVPRESLSIRGLRSAVRRVAVLGTGTELGHHITGGLDAVPGVTWIDAPAAADLDEYATVLAVELDGELDLYRGAGRD
jgi:alpha-L-fucosidase